MKILYMAAGAFLEWVIRTKEGKDFANKVVNKGYCLMKDNLSNVLSEAKSKLSDGVDGTILSNSRYIRDNKPVSESGTQRKPENS